VIARWQEPSEGPWTGDESSMRFSADERFLCLRHANSGRLTVRRLDGPVPAIHYQGSGASNNWTFDFSPDSKRLAYVLRDNRIAVADLISGEVRHLSPTGEDQNYIRFAPDGRRFAVVARRGADWAIDVRNAEAGHVEMSLPHPYAVALLAWHPN